MPPGIEQLVLEAVKQALAESQENGRYEIALLAVVFLLMALLLVWIVKHWIDQASLRENNTLNQAIEREKILTERIDKLEDYCRTELMKVSTEATKALLQNSIVTAESMATLARLQESLYTTRMCFATGENQQKLVEIIADRVAKEAQ